MSSVRFGLLSTEFASNYESLSDESTILNFIDCRHGEVSDENTCWRPVGLVRCSTFDKSGILTGPGVVDDFLSRPPSDHVRGRQHSPFNIGRTVRVQCHKMSKKCRVRPAAGFDWER